MSEWQRWDRLQPSVLATLGNILLEVAASFFPPLPLGANPGGAHYGVATFRVNNLYSVASLNEVCNNDRCKCHQTSILPGLLLAQVGKMVYKLMHFPFGRSPWDSSVAEMESPREGITT